MKSLVKLVAVSLFMFASVQGNSNVESVLGAQYQQWLVNTCPIYPTCKQEFQSVVTDTVTIEEKQMPLMANTCPIYPTCKQEFASELA
ncbi:hypothetical protein [Rheinheimera sp.]|uniref:hypothetical protein n=1 Tax=Rheinheimera sp. TaxID=1869214 RepID=UPI00307D1D32